MGVTHTVVFKSTAVSSARTNTGVPTEPWAAVVHLYIYIYIYIYDIVYIYIYIHVDDSSLLSTAYFVLTGGRSREHADYSPRVLDRLQNIRQGLEILDKDPEYPTKPQNLRQ